MSTTEDPDDRPGEPVDRDQEAVLGTPDTFADHDAPDSDGRLPADVTPEQVDALFAQIVAGFDAPHPVPPDGPRRPVMPAAGPVLNRRLGDPRSAGPDDPSILDGLDTFGTGLDETPEHFEPPAPPPLPKVSFAAILSVLAVILGLALILDQTLLPIDATVHLLLGIAGIIGGSAGLIMRLRPGDDDDGPSTDDGAVV